MTNKEKDIIPDHIVVQCKNMTLCINIMHVNGIPFLVTISTNVQFGTVTVLMNRRANTIRETLRKVFTAVHQEGDQNTTY